MQVVFFADYFMSHFKPERAIITLEFTLFCFSYHNIKMKYVGLQTNFSQWFDGVRNCFI